MSNDAFVRESGRPDAIEKAIRTLDALMANLETRLSREAQSEESAEEDWAKRWRDAVEANQNPFDEVHVSQVPFWAQAAYCHIKELQGFVELVEATFLLWQEQCESYYQYGIEQGRKLERLMRGEAPRGNRYFSN